MRPYPSGMMAARMLPNFTVQASPSFASVSGSGGTETTGSVTVSQVTGPSSSLTFSWSHVSGDSSISVASPTSATTTFSGVPPGAGLSTSAVKRCTVSNTFGQTATVDVTVTISQTGGGGGPPPPPPPPSLSVQISPDVLNTSHSHTSSLVQGYTSTVSGGTPPYTYSWSASAGSCAGGNSPSQTITFPYPGSLGQAFSSVGLHVVDSLGVSGDNDQGDVFITWT